MGTEEAAIAAQIVFLLKSFVKPRRLGMVLAPDALLRVTPAGIRMPDVTFIAAARLVGRPRPLPPVWAMSPDLAVEVLSISNTRPEMERKRTEYFAAGTRLVWEVDPPARAVEVFTDVDPFVRLTDVDTLTADPVLPGFAVPVSALFDIE